MLGTYPFDSDSEDQVVQSPSWKDLAMFLYYGRIIDA